MKITKRQLRRIIQEEKAKIIKENAGAQIPHALQDDLSSMQYRLPEEINGLLAQYDRKWWDNPELVRAVIIMLDNIKGEFEGYTS